MRVLWITGSLLPEAIAKIKGEPPQKWASTGSWILGAAAALCQQEGVELYMLSTSQLVKGVTRVETGRIVSYAIPYGKGHFTENPAYEKYMQPIHDEIQPDIVHIHGTEYSHALAWLKVCGSRHAVISIQGMTSVIHQYFQAGIGTWDVIKNISFRDLIRGGIFSEKRTFKKRGKFETEMIRTVCHVIGRTSWDRAHTWAINPNVTYHHVDETLRKEFLTGERWAYDSCTPHTIIAITSYSSPFKGLHQITKALPLILRQYPDTQLRVCGQDPTWGYQASQWWRVSGYGRYIKSLINQYGLREHILFAGQKNAEELKAELLKSNVFVCPSAIENSPNSLGEAQILGVPCVAAYVGGVMDMMRGNEENLYRYEEVEMMAEKICRVFRDKDRQVDMRAISAKRHDPKRNADELIGIYHSILEQQ